MTIRVVLADDHPVMRTGLRALLDGEPDMTVVGEATTGQEAQEVASDLQPDILLLDLSMPGPSAAETVRALHRNAPPTRVVMLTAYRDETAMHELVKLGVGGYVLKDDDPEVVAHAITTVAEGGTWFSPGVTSILTQRPRGSESMPVLTGREKQLLDCIRQGWDNRRIAAELNLRDQTVRNYLTTLYGKIGTATRAEAVVWAHEHLTDRG